MWVWSLLLTYFVWGATAVIFGLFLMGIGVLPIAILACIVKGNWPVFVQLLLMLVLTYGIRFWGSILRAGSEALQV